MRPVDEHKPGKCWKRHPVDEWMAEQGRETHPVDEHLPKNAGKVIQWMSDIHAAVLCYLFVTLTVLL